MSKYRKWLEWIISLVPTAFFAIIVGSYMSAAGQLGEQSEVGFNMATISALLGSFILTSGFVGRNVGLRQTGVLFLVATIAFVILGMIIPVVEEELWFMVVLVIALLVGIYSFSAAIVKLTASIPSLWSETKGS